MMDLELYKAEFVTAVYGATMAEGLEFAKILKNGGFQAPVFEDRKIFMDWVNVNVPHILILLPELGELDSLVEEVRKVSEEILILPAVDSKDLHNTLALAAKNLIYDFWLKPLASEVQVIVKMDRAIDRLLVQYATEQGASTTEPAPLSLKNQEDSSGRLRPSMAGGNVFNFYESLVGLAVDFSMIHERDPLIRHFGETLSRVLNHTPTLFFRWVPNSASLVLSHSSVLPLAQYRGLGLQFKEWSRSQVRAELLEPEGLNQLRTLMKKVFSKDHFNAYPLVVGGEIVGIFVLLDHVTGHLERRFIEASLAVLRANVERTDLLLKNHHLEIYDHITGLYNRRHMEETIDQEIARSRRTALPFSLVVMELDRAAERRSELGSDDFDELIRLVSKVLSKSGRANDVLCRVGEGLFVNLLPHTPLAGALVKAEKLRRLLEGTKFKMLQNSTHPAVTLSLGVSEYPSASLDAESLLRTADDAVASAKSLGGNKVVKALIPDHFKPDFVPVYQHRALEKGQASS